MSFNPDYMLRLAKQIQKDRFEEADRTRQVRRAKVEDGWWKPPIRWQTQESTASRHRRAS